MTVQSRVAEYLKSNKGKWIRPTLIAQHLNAPGSTVSACLSKLHDDNVVQKRKAKYAPGVEYSIAENAS